MYPVQLGKARHQLINQVYLIHLVLARPGAGYAGQSGQHRQHFRPHVHLGSVTQLQPSVRISASPRLYLADGAGRLTHLRLNTVQLARIRQYAALCTL